VLLVHGLLGRADDWAPVAERLAGQARVVALDLPGHGKQDRAGAVPSFDTAVDAIISQCAERFPGEPVHLVGYSLGGRLAWHAARRAPARWASLTLLSARPGMVDAQERAMRRASDAAWAEAWRTMPYAAWLARWYRQPVFASLARDPTVLEAMLAARCGEPSPPVEALLTEWGQGAAPPLDIQAAPHPPCILYMAGADDPGYAGAVPGLERLWPGLRAVIVPGAGHAVHIEQPECVAREIINLITTKAGV
jgi:2-succinyl-6-hydroxy-2,4-cyclohexadiene-1-carboxylate synthase